MDTPLDVVTSQQIANQVGNVEEGPRPDPIVIDHINAQIILATLKGDSTSTLNIARTALSDQTYVGTIIEASVASSLKAAEAQGVKGIKRLEDGKFSIDWNNQQATKLIDQALVSHVMFSLPVNYEP